MRIVASVFSLLALASCAATHKPGEVRVTPVETVEVFKTISQKCIDKMPPMPVLTAVPSTGVDQQALARIRREQTLILYVNEMRVTMAPCIKDPK